jgi:hypothetical protein
MTKLSARQLEVLCVAFQMARKGIWVGDSYTEVVDELHRKGMLRAHATRVNVSIITDAGNNRVRASLGLKTGVAK